MTSSNEDKLPAAQRADASYRESWATTHGTDTATTVSDTVSRPATPAERGTISQVTIPLSSATAQTGSPCVDKETASTSEAAGRPVFIAPIYSGGDTGVYIYRPPKGLKVPQPGTGSLRWPVIQLKGSNGATSLSPKTEKFREELTKIHRGPDSQLITVAEMKKYKLLLHESKQRGYAEFWVDDALGAIEFDSAMMDPLKDQEGKSVMDNVWKLRVETLVIPNQFGARPHIAGYVIYIPDNMFVCFFIYADATSR
jgi:hypothetical protein